MRRLTGVTGAAIAAVILPALAVASEVGDALPQHLYDGSISQLR